MSVEGEFGSSSYASRVGERLRDAREEQGLSLADVAQRTRIPRRHLEMIEEGGYDGLPAATYSAGFVKAYARLLGLDGQALSEAFRTEIGSVVARTQRPEPYAPADPRRTPPLGLAVAVLLVALVAGLGFLYWRGSSDQPVALAARGVAAPATVTPAAAGMALSPPPATMPVPGATGPVVIGASDAVWIKVMAGGKTLFMGTLDPGHTFQVPADAVDPVLTTGRPGVTTISVGQTPIPPVGDADRAAHDVSLRPEALLARMSTPAPPAQPPAAAPVPVENGAGPV